MEGASQGGVVPVHHTEAAGDVVVTAEHTGALVHNLILRIAVVIITDR